MGGSLSGGFFQVEGIEQIFCWWGKGGGGGVGCVGGGGGGGGGGRTPPSPPVGKTLKSVYK